MATLREPPDSCRSDNHADDMDISKDVTMNGNHHLEEEHLEADITQQPEEETEIKEDWKDDETVHYGVDQSPPVYVCLLLGLQHYISMFVATLTVPFLIAPAICMDEDHVGKSKLISTIFVASGFITLLQTIIGCRLPVVQAGTFAILAPTLAYLKLPQWQCPNNIITQDAFDQLNQTDANATYMIVGSEEHQELWMARLRNIQGSIMVAALFEVILGASGAIGYLLRFIGPLSICPTVSLLGLSLFSSSARYSEKHWWIAMLNIALMAIFSQYLSNFKIPCLKYNKVKGLHREGYPLLRMFPVMLSIMLTWFISFILTVTGVFSDEPGVYGHEARTDLRSSVITSSPWFRFPYPGQWGTPTVSIACVIALLSGIIATTVESVGDYHACAKLAGAPPPPLHAVNRGILVEGIGSILDGLWGTGNGTTSTSINVGVVGLTKVGSRRVVQYSAVYMIVFGVFTKFGALFITIPDPVIGGTFIILFGVIVAVGISSLQYVDMSSPRNLFIIGFSLFFGLTLPEWVKEHGTRIITGVDGLDSILQVLLSTNMFVGGMIGFFLDNTMPGTDEERGLAHWKKQRGTNLRRSKYLEDRISATYDLPIPTRLLWKIPAARYIPFLPTFQCQPPDSPIVHRAEMKRILETDTNGTICEV